MSATKATANEQEQRLQREAAFHDEWAATIDPSSLLVDETFTSPTAAENRYILEQFGSLSGKRVLDYGCGAAEGGVYFAKQGASVVAVDVSPESLRVAERLAAHHGVALETRQVTGPAIPGESGEFDLIYGNGVLHHVDLGVARPELARVMRASGKGCFIEPLTYNPVIEVYRHIAETVRTVDEHPLSFADIESFGGSFGSVTHREFWLTSLAVFLRFFLWERVNPNKERYWKKIYTDAERLRSFYEPLRKMDDAILARVPALGKLCWNTVITVTQPRLQG